MQTQETVTSEERIRVLTDAVLEVSRDLEISQEDLGYMLRAGDRVDTADRADGCLIGDSLKDSDGAAALVSIHRALLSLVGGDRDLARAWVVAPNRAFANQTPKTILLQDGGLMTVLDYLNSACCLSR